MISAEEAMHQTERTVHFYTSKALKHLCSELCLSQHEDDFIEKLAPYACVWAAMIQAAAQDFDSCVRSGIVGSTLANSQMNLTDTELLNLR